MLAGSYAGEILVKESNLDQNRILSMRETMREASPTIPNQSHIAIGEVLEFLGYYWI